VSICGCSVTKRYDVVQGWLLHRSQQESDILLGLFDRIYSDLVVFSVQNLNKKMVTLQCNEIVQVRLRIGSLSTWHTHTHTHARTHAHTFNGPLSGTTQVSRYQKGKTDLDFTEARDSEWHWNPLGHMQVCTSLQTDNHASTPPLSFLQAGCSSCRPTNSVKALALI